MFGISGTLTKVIIVLALISALGAGFNKYRQYEREDAVKDFVLDAQLKAAEARRANTATKNRITEEVNNATVDELLDRAIANGMFVVDDPD